SEARRVGEGGERAGDRTRGVGGGWRNPAHRHDHWLAGGLLGVGADASLLRLKRVRYDVVIASPDGGKVEIDTLSDPRDASKWSAEDLISMGFLSTPDLVALLDDTPRLADLDLDEFAAIVVCGGPRPVAQFRHHAKHKT